MPISRKEEVAEMGAVRLLVLAGVGLGRSGGGRRKIRPRRGAGRLETVNS